MILPMIHPGPESSWPFQAKLAEDLAEEEKRLEAQRLMEQQLREAPGSSWEFPEFGFSGYTMIY